MIRTVPMRRDPSYRRRRIGDAISSVAAFNPATAAVSAGVGLATSALASWMNSIQLSHNADTATTLIVNGLAQQLSNLDSAYLAEPNPTCADQRAALDAYDEAWEWLQSPAACGNPSYGSAGNRCISDRAPSGPYPWQTYYRDPIANDPRVASLGCDTGQDVLLPSLTTGSYADTGITSTGGSSTTGQTPQQIAAPPPAAAAPPALSVPVIPPAATVTTTAAAVPSSTYLYLGIGAIALLFLVTR